jgi:hypothetical protein
MLSEKYKYEQELAKGMKKIYDLNFVVSTMRYLAYLLSSLQAGIIGFKNDLLNQYNYTTEFTNSLRDEIIEPLKVFMQEQNNKGKKLNTEMKKVEKEFKEDVDRMDKV